MRHLLGRNSAIVLSCFQMSIIFLVQVAYTITGAQSLIQIVYTACEIEGMSPEEIETSSKCFGADTGGIWKMTLVFAAAELVLSQLRNLEEVWWVSLVGTLSSLTYTLITLILSFVEIANGNSGVVTSVSGITGISTADKVFGVFNALGAIASSYSIRWVLSM